MGNYGILFLEDSLTSIHHMNQSIFLFRLLFSPHFQMLRPVDVAKNQLKIYGPCRFSLYFELTRFRLIGHFAKLSGEGGGSNGRGEVPFENLGKVGEHGSKVKTHTYRPLLIMLLLYIFIIFNCNCYYNLFDSIVTSFEIFISHIKKVSTEMKAQTR